MLITFKRYGHANNSSSSHSIIFAPALGGGDTVVEDYNYNWETFTLLTRLKKEQYLITQFTLQECERSWEAEAQERNTQSFRSFRDKFMSHPKAHIVFKHMKEIFEQLESGDYGVDHQSVIVWPYDRLENSTSYDFFFDFSHEILFNDYVILGGNDNDGEHPLREMGDESKKNFLEMYHSIVDMERGATLAFKDPITMEWVLSNKSTNRYSRYTGSILKCVFGFDIPSSAINLNDPQIFFSNEKSTFFKKAQFPYLVDLKINSYCNFGCEFCYTSSTNKDSHADADYIISHILPTLQKARVFEIVLGGGEPTTHPRLLEIIKAAKDLNFKVGITTKNYNLQRHPDHLQIMQACDSIAVSINSLEELAQAEHLMTVYDDETRWYVQTILGLHEWKDTVELFEKAAETLGRFSFTLLGYKSFGFGKNVKSIQLDRNWFHDLKYLSHKHSINIGIDSIIANKYTEELLSNQIDWNYLVGSEGKTTCYIDAEKSTIAPSSFTLEGIEHFDFKTSNENDFLKTFAKF